MSIRYRLLDASEWSRAQAVVGSTHLPDPAAASAAIAEDTETGEILGILFMQLQMHMEPLVLSSPRINFANLYGTLIEPLLSHKGLRFYCFSDKPIVSKMAQHVGMSALPHTVFEGEVK